MDQAAIQTTLSNLVSWPFLSEPIWRWLVFIIAMSALLTAWNGVLSKIEGRP